MPGGRKLPLPIPFQVGVVLSALFLDLPLKEFWNPEVVKACDLMEIYYNVFKNS
jgi:hypothetical protein